jgi:endonuclease/exonuclease/phosphatase family metal-dependent hydrolase
MIIKILKRTLFTFIGLVLLSLAWYGLQRGLASNRQVQVIRTSVQEPPSSKNEALKVGAYNIAHGRGGNSGESNWNREIRKEEETYLSKIAAQIAEADLDIVILNEVDFNASWSGNRNQARFIAEKVGLPHVVELKNIDIVLPFLKLQFGNAILSKWPLQEVQVIELPPVKQWEVLLAGKKNALEAKVNFQGREISIVAIHFETRDKAVRMASVGILLERIKKSNTPYLLLGDFNSRRSESGKPTTAVEKLIAIGGFKNDVVTETWKTFPSESPQNGIDWILTNAPLKTSNSTIIHSPLSDHLMITSEVSFTD